MDKNIFNILKEEGFNSYGVEKFSVLRRAECSGIYKHEFIFATFQPEFEKISTYTFEVDELIAEGWELIFEGDSEDASEFDVIKFGNGGC